MTDTNNNQTPAQPSKLEADIQKVEAEAKGILNWIKSHAVLSAAIGGLLVGFIAGLLV